MIPCPDCGVLYGTKHTADCPMRTKNWYKLRNQIIRGKVEIMKTPENHEWPDFLQNETPEAPKEKAMRFNDGKPQLSYITDFPNAVTGLARIMEFGAQKYERDNWKKGLEINEYIDCFMRHVTDYKRGIVYDNETGLHQFFHMAVNAMMLAEVYGKTKPITEKDDVADAMAWATMGDALSETTSRRPVDDTATPHDQRGQATAAGTASTGEDGPPLEPTLKDEGVDKAINRLDDLMLARNRGVVSFSDVEMQIITKKAIELAAKVGTGPLDILNEYAMMFFNDPLKRNEFYAACRREIVKNNKTTVNSFVKPDDEIDLLRKK